MYRLLAFLSVFFLPVIALAQDTPGPVNVIPPTVPPPDVSWPALIAAGSFYVFSIVALIRRADKSGEKIDGWIVPVVIVPLVSIGVSIWQMGISSPAMTVKHAGVLYMTAYGGVAGLRQMFGWGFAWLVKAYQAWRSNQPIAPPSNPPPSLADPNEGDK